MTHAVRTGTLRFRYLGDDYPGPTDVRSDLYISLFRHVVVTNPGAVFDVRMFACGGSGRNLDQYTTYVRSPDTTGA